MTHWGFPFFGIKNWRRLWAGWAHLLEHDVGIGHRRGGGEHEHHLAETIFWKGEMPGAQGEQPIPLAPGLMDSALVLLFRWPILVLMTSGRTSLFGHWPSRVKSPSATP